MPIQTKDYDPEYLKLIQSLGELDDFSIWDNLDTVDDEEFRLSDLDEDDDELDDDDDDDLDDEHETSVQPAGSNAATISTTVGQPTQATTIPGTPSTMDNKLSDPLQKPLQTPILSSPSLNLPGWEDDQKGGGAFYKDLEEELGSLLEEELEAAVRSLYTTKGSTADPEKKKKPAKKTVVKKQAPPQALPPGTFVATGSAGASGTPVTAATLAAEAKRKEREAKEGPGTPLRETARQGNSAVVSYKQSQQLRTLMKKHYQLLAQQAILSVRAAHSIKSGNNSSASSTAASPTTSSSSSVADKKWGGDDFQCGENETDLTEILDLAVGMLQDLDQNRKDAIRTSIQLAMSSNASNNVSSHGDLTKTSVVNGTQIGKSDETNGKQQEQPQHPAARRSLLSQFSEDSQASSSNDKTKNDTSKMLASQATTPSNQGGGRLTRAAFRKLQAQPIVGSKRTAFDIPGLLKLDETFATIDDSVNITTTSSSSSSGSKKVNILEASTHAHACRDVLKDAGANVEEALLPGVLDVSENFSQLQEHLGDDFSPPCTAEQEQFLRKNRNLFTSGEDNLVLRGVNLYGEKQWILIGDRYLPDRSVNIISQRYAKLSVMLYKAHGIHIDSEGLLLEPPKHESVDDIDEKKIKAVGLKLVEPPAILNVHRWSLEEDLTILKAVPIMGHMWAELGARLIPHRDRGHLRKRYQVLERRVKATITRGKKDKARNETRARGTTKGRAKTPTKGPRSAKKATLGATTAKARGSPGRKDKKLTSPAGSAKAKAATKTSASKRKGAKSMEIDTKAGDDSDRNSTSPMMSLEKGAELLACLKPKETKQAQAAKAASSQVLPPAAASKSGAKSAKDNKPVYPPPPYIGSESYPPPPGDHRRPYYPYPHDRAYYEHYYRSYYQHHHPPSEDGKSYPPVPPPPYYYPPPHATDHKMPLHLTSPKPSTSRPTEFDTPNSKSFMANISKMVGEDFSAFGGDGETSRQALEKLEKMMSNKDESEAAKAIVTHLAKSPGRGVSELSNLLNSDSNITGLSLLNDISKAPEESGLSIMARVLQSSKDSISKLPESMPSPSKKSSVILPPIRTPTKLKGESFFRSATGDPETPQRGAASVLASPLGLSPGFSKLRDSALLKDEAVTNSLAPPFSPPPTSNLLKTEGLATNHTFPYSLGPTLSRDFDEEKNAEDNRFDFQDARVCEDSNQLGDLAVGAPLLNAEQPNGNSLSIPQEEFDAISGLGALSNSPFKSVKAESKKNKPSQSLFRRVIGDSKEKSPSKKLF